MSRKPDDDEKRRIGEAVRRALATPEARRAMSEAISRGKRLAKQRRREAAAQAACAVTS